MQPWAITRYLFLSLWPSPLQFAYIKNVAHGFWQVAIPAFLVGLILVGVMVASWKRHWTGFLGLWFFLILAPTSSVFPLSAQTVAEHRVYLSLAAVMALVVMGAHGAWRRLPKSASSLAVLAVMLPLAALGALTIIRNGDYRDSISIWADSISKWPADAENSDRPGVVAAHHNLAVALYQDGRRAEAIEQYEKALAIDPGYSLSYNGLGVAWDDRGEFGRAEASFNKALELNPRYANAHSNLAVVLAETGRGQEAIEHYQAALSISPGYAEAHNGLGIIHLRAGQWERAILEFQKALESRPGFVDARSNLGMALAQGGKVEEAMVQYQEAMELDPGRAITHDNLGQAMMQKGRWSEAQKYFAEAVALRPVYQEAWSHLGGAYLAQERWAEAIAAYEKALELKEEDVEAHCNLGNALLQQGRVGEALRHYERGLQLDAREIRVMNNLAWVLATSMEAEVRDGARAVALGREASRLAGGENAAIMRTLGAALAEAGRYAEAEQTARQGGRLAAAQGDSSLAQALESDAQLYREAKPLRDNRSLSGAGQPGTHP
jgi:tetratricopeptide (TPR) repeat protein